MEQAPNLNINAVFQEKRKLASEQSARTNKQKRQNVMNK